MGDHLVCRVPGIKEIIKLREALLNGIKLTIESWSTDAAVGDVRLHTTFIHCSFVKNCFRPLRDIIKAMASLPSDMTPSSLPAGPLLELVMEDARLGCLHSIN